MSRVDRRGPEICSVLSRLLIGGGGGGGGGEDKKKGIGKS